MSAAENVPPEPRELAEVIELHPAAADDPDDDAAAPWPWEDAPATGSRSGGPSGPGDVPPAIAAALAFAPTPDELEAEAAPEPDRRLAAALALAAAGFEILELYAPTKPGDCTCPARSGTRTDRPDRSCSSPGKHPVGDDWQRRGMTDPAAIAAVARNPRRQFGAFPAAGSGLLVVDEDVPAALERLGPLPASLTVATSKGRHLYGRVPDGFDAARIPGRWAGGEIRAHGSGQVVAPWGRHASGAVYTPLGTVRVVAELPAAWLEALIASEAGARAARQADPGWFMHSPGRHEALTDRARHLRGVGLTGDRLRAELERFMADHLCPGGCPAGCRTLAGDLEGILSWTGRTIGDDPPAVPLIIDDAAPEAREPQGIDAADLLALELAPLRWIVPDILPEGTTILASPPKVGKSCLVYQVAVEVAIGGELLGRRATPGSALYLALEDGQRRGQGRLRAALAGRTMPHGRLEVRWSARRIGDGLEDDVAAWLADHPDAALVAIDTLGKVRPRSDGRRNAYEVDVADLARLQDLFRDRPVALVIVHHARKEASDDFLASVSGTYGITGSADTIVVIRRKRLEAFGTLLVTGRDVPDAEIPARFDGLTWQPAPAALPAATFERTEVFRVIEAEGPLFPKAIADRLDLERTSVQHMVDALVRSGAVARTTRGYVATAVIREPDPPSRTHAGVPDHSDHSRGGPESLPDHSDHWGSEYSDYSDRGHPRGDEPSTPRLTVVPPEPPDLFDRPAAPPCFADPDLYRAHAFDHYNVESAAPGCRACEAADPAEVPA